MSTATEEIVLARARMFDGIAARYDRLNRVMSFGLDQGWRRRAVAALDLREDDRVLDVATGTADLAIQIAEAHPSVSVVGVDVSEGMLAVGSRKVEEAGLSGRVRLGYGDALHLNYDDASFAGATIAFGLRNIPDRPRALREMARVVRPGGRVVVLELAQPKGRGLSFLARLHVRFIVPLLGRLLSKAVPYAYLKDSIEALSSVAIVTDFRSAGLDGVSVRPLFFGACWLFVARKAAP